MKKIILLFLTLLHTLPLYPQNLFNLIKPSRNILRQIKYPINIQRVTIVETSHLENAIRIASFQSSMRQHEELYKQRMLEYNNKPVWYLTQNIKQFNCKPENLYGTYSYLSICSRYMSGKEWKNPNVSAEFVIDRRLLQLFYGDILEKYNNGSTSILPQFNEFMINAPAIIHPLAKTNEFTKLSSIKVQLAAYRTRGIKGILDIFFKDLNTFNKSNNLMSIPEDVVKGTYLEAKLWADYYDLKWE